MGKKTFNKLKQIAEGSDTVEKQMLSNALLIEKIKRKPLSTEKCIAILQLIVENQEESNEN